MNENLAFQIADELPGRLRDHSLRVGNSLFPSGKVTVIAGYLHDTVEDGYMTLLGIRAFFGKDVSDAVDAVSRREQETYEQFIDRANAHPIGRIVKLADVRDNLATMHAGKESLRPRYEAALKILETP